jgi:hypothetical protein
MRTHFQRGDYLRQFRRHKPHFVLQCGASVRVERYRTVRHRVFSNPDMSLNAGDL